MSTNYLPFKLIASAVPRQKENACCIFHRIKTSFVLFLFITVFSGIQQFSYAAVRLSTGTQRALLIGIADYRDPKSVGPNGDLLGPVNDVNEMQTVLLQRWGFQDIRVLTDRDASFRRIKEAMQQLLQDSNKGDHVFFFYSGHGTSAEDNNAPVPYGSGAQLPYDFPFNGTRQQQLQHMIIGQRDLQPVFKAMEKKGVNLFVAIDSCYSGQAVRALNAGLINRAPLLSRNVPIAADDQMSADLYQYTRLPLPPYPYEKVFFISAATEKQQASDINIDLDNAPRTRSGKSHGAFSDALLRALWGELPETNRNDRPVTHLQLYQAVKNYMGDKFNQTPSMLPDIDEDTGPLPLAYQPIFGYSKALSLPVITKISPITLQLKNLPEPFHLRLKKLHAVKIIDNDADYVLTRQKQDYLFGFASGQVILRTPDPNSVIKRIKREAWFKQLLSKAHEHSRINLDFRLSQNYYGNILMQNDTVSFRLRSDQEGYLVLFDLMPNGDIVTLYPANNGELASQKAGQISAIPAENMPAIKVLPPFGSDYLMAFYFKQAHDFIKTLMQQPVNTPDSPAMQNLEQAINGNGLFGFMHLKLTTVKRL